MNTEVVSKRMQMLKEVVPGLRRVAVLANSVNPIHALFMQETESTARMLGLELQPLEVHGPEDFEAAFAAATRSKADALVAFDDSLTLPRRRGDRVSLPTSAFDAVDGSSTRHASAMDLGAVRAPTIWRSYPCKRS